MHLFGQIIMLKKYQSLTKSIFVLIIQPILLYNIAMNKKGIFKTKRKDGSVYYRVSITRNSKHISLGSFDKIKYASKCYEEAAKIFDYPEIVIDSYDESFTIPYEKFIILINFRDNGIYISNPVYLRPNFFYYYLDKDTILKFDRDDLFYFSKHKIIKRGGHLFCNEYGNQINLLEKYSIGSYAVKDKDYRFINGDPYDFRYSNIEIINRYHGVRKIVRNNKTFYEVKIHLKGYIKVGEFEDEITAAIAYNKAVDQLKKKYDKNFIQNFPDLSPKEYALIYTEIKLPDSIIKYNK